MGLGLLSKAKNIFYKNFPSNKVKETSAPCMNCGYRFARMMNTKVIPDFNIKEVDASLRQGFLNHEDGICANCGLYQAYNRFSTEELNQINKLGKDALTSFDVYHEYPVPESFVKEFNRNMPKHISRWEKVFSELSHVPKKALLLRYWFGEHAKFLLTKYKPDISGVEMSEICRRYVSEFLPEFKDLQGEINGHLFGEYLSSGPYDTVFSSHILCHSCDLRDTLQKISSLTSSGGLVVFEAETKIAPSNPFHKVYLGEYQLYSILCEYFKDVFCLDVNGIMSSNEVKQEPDRIIEHIAIK